MSRLVRFHALFNGGATVGAAAAAVATRAAGEWRLGHPTLSVRYRQRAGAQPSAVSLGLALLRSRDAATEKSPVV